MVKIPKNSEKSTCLPFGVYTLANISKKITSKNGMLANMAIGRGRVAPVIS
jgi:hypothetical protein